MGLVPFSKAHLVFRLALFGCFMAVSFPASTTETRHPQTAQNSVVEILNAQVDWGYEWIIVDNGNTEDGDGDKRDDNNSGGKRALDDQSGDSRYIIVDNGNTEDGDGDKRDDNNSGGKRALDDQSGDSRYIIVDNGNTEDGDGDKRDDTNSGGKRSLQHVVLTDGVEPRYQLQPYQADAWLISLNTVAQFTVEKPQGNFQINRILADEAGLVWVFGAFKGDLQWRDHRLNALGRNDLFVAHINELGELSWLRRVGGTGDDFLASVRLTQEGGLVMGVRSQQFESLLDDDSFTLSGSEAFTLALDPRGKMSWVERNY